MKRNEAGGLLFSPSDLIRYSTSPFASWMDRYHLENPGAVAPDLETEDQALIARTGDEHEQTVLTEFKAFTSDLVEISKASIVRAREETRAAFARKPSIIYQAYLEDGDFAGYSDFLILDTQGAYEVWDTKLARSPKPYYAIQLCCYSEMLAKTTGGPIPEKFGIILGTKERVELQVEDFIYYYRELKRAFFEMQRSFSGNFADRPEPLPRADHGRWSSYAGAYFTENDHLVQVAGITVGQIKKLRNAGIETVRELAEAGDRVVPKLAEDSLRKLADQARLQSRTTDLRKSRPDAPPAFEVLSQIGRSGEPVGLAALPPADPADVFFDMEGYPLVPGGLEFLFGVWTLDGHPSHFLDWWAHDREGEKTAFEGFIDWVFMRWLDNRGLHIYHYAAYEVSAVRRLSTRHDTRQDEVDELLRQGVFVDLYQIVRNALRIGEESYSIKKVERLYRPKRATEVATAVDSIVQYANWIATHQSPDWQPSAILKDIRDYNEDDCKSTAELLDWLRCVAAENGIPPRTAIQSELTTEATAVSDEVRNRLETVEKLRQRRDYVSHVLADLIGFHRREAKPIWWRMFDRAQATPEELRDDLGCIEGVRAVGEPRPEKQSLVQTYCFDPSQECKLEAGEQSKVMFTCDLGAKFTLFHLDLASGKLELKLGMRTLHDRFRGEFPQAGSLIPDEIVSASAIEKALAAVAETHLSGNLPAPAAALLKRMPPASTLQASEETTTEAAIRVVRSMTGGCLVIQGPPGTGKTYTASHVIADLLDAGKSVGIASNSHKAVINLLRACSRTMAEAGREMVGIKVGDDENDLLFSESPGLRYVKSGGSAKGAFSHGVVGGTAWLFTRPEWENALDYLFIDEAGQVSLANTVAMARCARNLILLGDQMQLEQPIQGSHPGDAGLSALQYALKDQASSAPDRPVFHPVVPADYGLFLGESRRMHPSVCRFISDSIYQGRLKSEASCARQSIDSPYGAGIVFVPVRHDGNVQRSDEEIEQVGAIYRQLAGSRYTAKDGGTRDLTLDDFLFIAPYNAQVRGLKSALPPGARVGSVDKFQGQEAPVCILSLCSSYGEYGSRGLGFILDRNRINVAISRAMCLAIVVADPRIATNPASSLEEMTLTNLFCKITRNG
ncbi:MAG: TM0106 family RecB-like putative nuclease [Fimbriimonas sp.]|nr:TM0106 family RecB-like putative nuclease [Fimbriimonas sp.]